MIVLLCTFVDESLRWGDGAHWGTKAEVVKFEPGSLTNTLSKDEDARLVIWSAPVFELVGAGLYFGMSEEAARTWAAEIAEASLSVFRKARRQVVILPREVSDLKPEAVEPAIQTFFKDRSSLFFKIGVSELSDMTPRLLMCNQLAKLIVEADRKFLSLSDELAASMAQSVYEPEAQTLLAQRALQGMSASTQTSVESAPEGEALSSSDLGAQRALIHDLQTALDACQGEVEYYHSIAAKKPGGLEEQKLRRELNTVRRERDRARDELAAIKEQHQWTKLDAEQLRVTLDEIRSSTSWKVTAPLRKIRGGAPTPTPKDEGEG